MRAVPIQPSSWCRPGSMLSCRLQVVAALLLILLVAAPSTASAHATLEASTPAADAVTEQVPSEVTLEFSGSVVAGRDSIRVFTGDGKEVQHGAPAPRTGSSITQAIDADDDGTYFVSYVVSSEDGHVINGSLQFSVGIASTGGVAGADASASAASVPRTLQLSLSITRFIEVVALLLVAGGGMFASILAPGWRPRLLVLGLCVLLAAYVAGFVITSAILHGGLGQGLDGSALEATAHTPFGRSTMLRTVVALVAAGPVLLLASRTPPPTGARVAMAMVFAGLAASLSTTGHAVTTEPTWLRMPLDMAHVLAAAVWLGGLVQLAHMAPFANSWLVAIIRFSRVAFASVVVILVTGAYATVAELGIDARDDLVDSTYGRLILGKFALYIATMPLAWNNMTAFVPSIRHRPDDAPRMLRQYVRRELLLVITVVALTVWLIATPQPG